MIVVGLMIACRKGMDLFRSKDMYNLIVEDWYTIGWDYILMG